MGLRSKRVADFSGKPIRDGPFPNFPGGVLLKAGQVVAEQLVELPIALAESRFRCT